MKRKARKKFSLFLYNGEEKGGRGEKFWKNIKNPFALSSSFVRSLVRARCAGWASALKRHLELTPPQARQTTFALHQKALLCVVFLLKDRMSPAPPARLNPPRRRPFHDTARSTPSHGLRHRRGKCFFLIQFKTKGKKTQSFRGWRRQGRSEARKSLISLRH